MKREIELILQHGWAYDRYIWSRVSKLAAAEFGADAEIKIFDRGYFAAPNAVSWQAGASNQFYESNQSSQTNKSEVARLRALICHSFGLHLVPQEIVTTADLIVIAGGFLSIHPDEARLAARSRATIENMLTNLHQSPSEAVLDFYELCGASRSIRAGSSQAEKGTTSMQIKAPGENEIKFNILSKSEGELMAASGGRQLQLRNRCPRPQAQRRIYLHHSARDTSREAFKEGMGMVKGIRERMSEQVAAHSKGAQSSFNDQLDQQLLAADLALLSQSRFDPAIIAKATKVVIVHGKNDPVVPFDRAIRLNQAIPTSTLVAVENAGHSLPVTHPHLCLGPIHDLWSTFSEADK